MSGGSFQPFLLALPVLIKFQIVLILLLLVCFFYFSFFILKERIRKNKYFYRLTLTEKRTENLLSEVIFDETFFEQASSDEGKRNIRLLFKDYGSGMAKEVLSDTIFKLFRSFSGDFAERMKTLYSILNFEDYSISKLKDRRWEIKVKGMREIAQMRVKNAAESILPYINHPNDILRQESRLAYVKVDPENLKYFIEEINSPISDWEIINLIEIIGAERHNYLADFEPVFSSKNYSLIYFCLEVITYFKITKYTEDVVKLLDHRNSKIVKSTIKALGVLGAYHTTSILKLKYDYMDAEGKLETIKTLGILGTQADIDFLLNIVIVNTNNKLRLTAVKSLIALGGNTVSMLEDIHHSLKDEDIRKMIEHSLDPRVS